MWHNMVKFTTSFPIHMYTIVHIYVLECFLCWCAVHCPMFWKYSLHSQQTMTWATRTLVNILLTFSIRCLSPLRAIVLLKALKFSLVAIHCVLRLFKRSSNVEKSSWCQLILPIRKQHCKKCLIYVSVKSNEHSLIDDLQTSSCALCNGAPYMWLAVALYCAT